MRNQIITVGSAALLLLALPTHAQDTPASVVDGTVPFEASVLATGLEAPWEITWGPDDYLWVTERVAGRVVRINPVDGTKVPAVTLDDVVTRRGQDGLLGLALHPELLIGTGMDHVFVAYTYTDPTRPAHVNVSDETSPYRHLYAKIVRLTYDPATQTLSDPQTVIEGLTAGRDHNSGRLKVGPDLKLYYTIGDQGHGQFANVCLPIEAQRLPTAAEIETEDYSAYQGKSLRLNLDGSIPEDNPVLDGVRSHVFTWGHRNMQGIAFGPDGTLYASEHGPKTDDEVNILVPGGNYGWPHVAGFRDDMAYRYARWFDATTPCEDLTFSDLAIDPSVPQESETSWPGEMQDPLATLFTVPDDWDFADPLCEGINFICWPTVAPSSIETYFSDGGEGIPGWGDALLITTLKRGSVYRIPLAEDGKTASGPAERYFRSENRFRDLALSRDLQTIYVATDPGGLTGAQDGGVTDRVQNPGSILAFKWQEPN